MTFPVGFEPLCRTCREFIGFDSRGRAMTFRQVAAGTTSRCHESPAEAWRRCTEACQAVESFGVHIPCLSELVVSRVCMCFDL